MTTEEATRSRTISNDLDFINAHLPTGARGRIRAAMAPSSTRNPDGVARKRIALRAALGTKSQTLAPLNADDVEGTVEKLIAWVAENGETVEWPQEQRQNLQFALASERGQGITFREDLPGHVREDSPTRQLSKMLPSYFKVAVHRQGEHKVVVFLNLPQEYQGKGVKTHYSWVAHEQSRILEQTQKLLSELAALRQPFYPEWKEESQKNLVKLARGEISLDLPWTPAKRAKAK